MLGIQAIGLAKLRPPKAFGRAQTSEAIKVNCRSRLQTAAGCVTH